MVSKIENDVLSITRARNVGDFKAPGEVIEVINEESNEDEIIVKRKNIERIKKENKKNMSMKMA